MIKHFVRSLLILPLLISCIEQKEPVATYTSLMVTRGDVVAVSLNTDALVVFDNDGEFKRILYQLPNPLDVIAGMTWLESTNEILITVDGTPDRIEAISVVNGSSRPFYNNTTFFTGTIQGVAQLKNSSDIVASEGTSIERFSPNGVREVWGLIWPTTTHINNAQLIGLSSGNLLSCSSTAGIRILPDSTSSVAAVATLTGPAGATASFGCGELSNGQIVIGWNGAAVDYITVYSASLVAVSTIINNVQSTISNPRGIAVDEDDFIFVADATYNKIVKMDVDGNVVKQFGTSILNSPKDLIVIPSFTP